MQIDPSTVITELKKKLSTETNFMKKLELKDKILELEYKYGIKKQKALTGISCIGCSA